MSADTVPLSDMPACTVQSVTCLATDARSRDGEFDPARSHTFVEIDHEINSTVILLPSAESFKKVPIVEVCNCSMLCCTLLYVHSSIAIILMGKRELIALLNRLPGVS